MAELEALGEANAVTIQQLQAQVCVRAQHARGACACVRACVHMSLCTPSKSECVQRM